MPNPSVVTNSPVPIMCYEQLLDHAAGGLQSFRWPKLDEGLPCGLCYTSGTTGNPKVLLAVHAVHAQLVACDFACQYPACRATSSYVSLLLPASITHAATLCGLGAIQLARVTPQQCIQGTTCCSACLCWCTLILLRYTMLMLPCLVHALAACALLCATRACCIHTGATTCMR